MSALAAAVALKPRKRVGVTDIDSGSSSSSDSEESVASTVFDLASSGLSDTDYKKEDKDFIWVLTEEPHRSRRLQIMKEHPEVTKLMGHEPLTKWLVLAVVLLQLSTAYALRSTHPLSWQFVLCAYVIGGTANQNLFLAIHEVTHNLAFRSMVANRWLAIFANFPIGIPYAMLFKKYHIEHHKFLGEDGIDTDLPSRFEALILDNVFGKAFFCTFQILFYALRPGFIRAQKFTKWAAFNFTAQFLFNFLLIKSLGWNAYAYLVMSAFMAGSLHPCAGHFIAEHYVFNHSEQETASYYGWMNILTYNVGYHQEHHDFCSIPWTRLPKLHAIAKDHYQPLFAHKSWPGVTLQFIFDDAIGMFSRVKRPCKQERDLQKFESQQSAAAQGGEGSYGGVKD